MLHPASEAGAIDNCLPRKKMWMIKVNSFIKLFIVFISAAFLCSDVQAQAPCTSGNGVAGTCIGIYKCPALLALVNKPNRSKQDYETLRKSQCGFESNNPLVCCPEDVTTPAPTTSAATPAPTPAPSNTCFTPDGQQGSCVTLYSCSHLTKLLQQPVSSENLAFVQNSRCQSSEQYSVCCGPSAPIVNAVTQPTECIPAAAPPDPRTLCCGVESEGANRITGGNITAIDQYPWLTIIEYRKDDKIKLLCGGVLISGRYVLSAAHCVTGPVLTYGTPINVRLGEFDTAKSGPDCVEVEGGGTDCTDGALIVPIEKTIPHKEYNPNNPLRRHDIALVRLAQMAPYTDFIRPICLPTTDVTVAPTTNMKLFAAGWGAVSDTQSSSQVKLHVDLPYLSIKDCQPSYNVPRRRVTLWEGQLCAGGDKGKDSCKGDSGGPLMYERGRFFEVLGIVSFGPTPCGLENVPGVYTKVYEYLPWIRSQIEP